MAIDAGRWLPSFFYRSRQSFIMIVLYSLEIEIIDTNNVDFLHTFYRRWERHVRKPGRFCGDKKRNKAVTDNMIGDNSAVSEWKENFRMSQPTSSLTSLFWSHFVSCCRGNKQLVNHFITNVTEVVAICTERSGNRISLHCISPTNPYTLKLVNPETLRIRKNLHTHI